MRRPLILTLAIAALLISTTTSASSNRETLQKKFEGTWELADDSAAKKEVERIVESTVAKLSFYKRPFARGRLEEVCSPCDKIRIAFPEDEIAITCDDKKTYESPADGSAVEHEPKEGDAFQLTHSWDDGAIKQVHDAPGGKRTTYFRVEDGELEWDTELTSPKLPAPMDYAFTYEQ